MPSPKAPIAAVSASRFAPVVASIWVPRTGEALVTAGRRGAGDRSRAPVGAVAGGRITTMIGPDVVEAPVGGADDEGGPVGAVATGDDEGATTETVAAGDDEGAATGVMVTGAGELGADGAELDDTEPDGGDDGADVGADAVG